MDDTLTLYQPMRNTRLSFHGVQFDDESFKNPLFYGFRVTHFPKKSPRLGYALEFLHFKMYADPNGRVHAVGVENGTPVDRIQRLGDTIQRFSISHGVNFLSANVVGRLQLHKSPEFPHGRVQPYAAVGIAGLLLHPESIIGGDSFQHYEWDGLGPQFTTGIDYQITRRFSVFGEAKFTGGGVNVDVVGGHATTGTTSYHLIFGTAYTFR